MLRETAVVQRAPNAQNADHGPSGVGNLSNGATENEAWVEAPPLFTIAWIPRFGYYGRVPAGLWKHRYWYSWIGMMLTGNHPPPRRFANSAELERFIRRKAYRAIVGFIRFRLRSVRGAETEHQPDVTKIYVMGFTPIANIYHSLGEGWTITSDTSGTGITFLNSGNDQHFRVGKCMNWLHERLTGHKLPHATISISYSLSSTGKYEACISTTNIPNVTVYVDGVAVADYCLSEISKEQAEDFVAAITRNVQPQLEHRFVIRGQVGAPPWVAKGGDELLLVEGED